MSNQNWPDGPTRSLLKPITAGGPSWFITGNAGVTQTLCQYRIPGRRVGLVGSLDLEMMWWTLSSNTNNRQCRATLNGVDVFLPAASALNSLATLETKVVIQANNSQTSQIAGPKTKTGTTSTFAPQALTIDLSEDQILEFSGNVAVGTDYIYLMPRVWLTPSWP